MLTGHYKIGTVSGITAVLQTLAGPLICVVALVLSAQVYSALF